MRKDDKDIIKLEVEEVVRSGTDLLVKIKGFKPCTVHYIDILFNDTGPSKLEKVNNENSNIDKGENSNE